MTTLKTICFTSCLLCIILAVGVGLFAIWGGVGTEITVKSLLTLTLIFSGFAGVGYLEKLFPKEKA